MTWSEGAIRQLTDAWTTGDSASVIGRAMGKTRNAILGMVHRLKLPPRMSVSPGRSIHKAARKSLAPKAAKALPKVKPVSTGRRNVNPLGRKSGTVSAAPFLAPPRPAGDPLDIVYPAGPTALPVGEAGSAQCRFPLWPSRQAVRDLGEADRLVCGAPIEGDSLLRSFCAEHRAIARSRVAA